MLFIAVAVIKSHDLKQFEEQFNLSYIFRIKMDSVEVQMATDCRTGS